MDRNQFAETAAKAYIEQFITGDKVMNDVVVVYDTTCQKFYSQSSLVPRHEDEILVLILKEGMFGDDEVGEDDLVRHLAEADDIWGVIVARVKNDGDEDYPTW